MEIILFFIGIALGILPCALIYWFVLRRKLRVIYRLNESTIQQEEELKSNIYILTQELEELIPKVEFQKATSKSLQEDISKKQAQQEAITASLALIEQQAQVAAEAIYEKNFTLMESTLEKSAEAMGEKYREEQESYQVEYLNTLKDLAQGFADEVAEKKVEIANAESTLLDLRAKVWAAVMADKRALEMQEAINYYKLNLPKTDIEEIAKLRTVLPYLKDKEPLNKVIWKVYYEKPYTDMVGRVIGSEVRTGIYKITNLSNQMCYVGQAVDLASRWKQHIKRGLGAETPTRNKLYPAMEEFGVENFSFEVVEECDRSQLDEREDYWQEYFKAKEFGYSIK